MSLYPRRNFLTDVTAKVLRIVETLRETPGLRILKAGNEESERILSTAEKKGAFRWCPQLMDWLENPDYLFRLGMSAVLFPRKNHGETAAQRGT